MSIHDIVKDTSESVIALSIGWGGTLANIHMDVFPDILTYIPGIISSAFVIWRWYVSIVDRKKKNKN